MTVAHAFDANAQVKKVKGQYTYYGDQNDSPASAKKKALEGAILNALQSEFGTIVSQDVMQADRIGAHGEDSKFLSINATEVKGEWIANDGDPKYEVEYGNDDCIIVTCHISGTAKAISNESVDFETLALRNGNTRGNASTEYHQGDNLYLYLNSPVDGYVQVYLQLENGETLKLLPYQLDTAQEVKVKKNQEYVFFDSRSKNSYDVQPDEFEITTDGDVEFNKLFVIFSPKVFTTPTMRPARSAYELPYLTEEDFRKWLSRSRRNDPKMGVKQINLKLLAN